jgi:hypothetical protein
VSRVNTRIESPMEAFDLHTKFLAWREVNPQADGTVHASQFSANVSAGLGERKTYVSKDDIDSMKKAKAFHAYHNAMITIDNTMIRMADTVYLSDELKELVMTAESTMPDDILFRTDVYTPCGFVFLETPLEMRVESATSTNDIDRLVDFVTTGGGSLSGDRLYQKPESGNILPTGEVWHIKAFAWGHSDAILGDALNAVHKKYGNKSGEALFADAEKNKMTERLNVRIYGSLERIEVDGLILTVPPDAYTAPLTLCESISFLYGEEGTNRYKEAYASVNGDIVDITRSRALGRYIATKRFILALFRLMEEYVDRDTEKVQRPFARRAMRAGRTGDFSNVTTLSLRRTIYGESESGTGRKITLAHIVRGHWRRQWYPSQKMHRAKWINAHRRGGNIGDTPVQRHRVIKVTN